MMSLIFFFVFEFSASRSESKTRKCETICEKLSIDLDTDHILIISAKPYQLCILSSKKMTQSFHFGEIVREELYRSAFVPDRRSVEAGLFSVQHLGKAWKQTAFSTNKENMENNYPIIGILSQKIIPISKDLEKNLKDYSNYTSYIAASYVKYIESSGARVMPIFIGKDRQYYEETLSKINGVLLPGGAEWYTEENGYAVAGKHIYEIAKKLNEKGVYFPIFGICLGFELLFYLSAYEKEHRGKCENLGRTKNAIFKKDFRSSRMFENIPDRVVELFSTKPVANYFHRFCETEEILENLDMDQNWKVLMTGTDVNEKEFINAIESKKYPFYGVQFHPEKSAFEWTRDYISHSADAIEANRYFGDFFIKESRKNNQKYESKEEELSSLICNYDIVYTGKNVGTNRKYEQCYIFRHQ